MDTLFFVLDVIKILAIAAVLLKFFTRINYIYENTERAANALEYIANRLDQDSGENILDKIEKELNSR